MDAVLPLMEDVHKRKPPSISVKNGVLPLMDGVLPLMDVLLWVTRAGGYLPTGLTSGPTFTREVRFISTRLRPPFWEIARRTLVPILPDMSLRKRS